MLYKRATFLTCISITMLFCFSAKADEAIATASYVKGRVTVRHNNKDNPLSRGTPLYQGDQVNAGKHSKATLVFMDGTIKVVRADKSLTIGKKTDDSKTRSVIEVGKAAIKYFFGADQKKSNLRALAGTRGGEEKPELAALYPVGELTTHPKELVWTPLDGVKSYTVKIHEDTGVDDPNVPGETLDVKTNRIEISKFKTRLLPEKIYIWRVTAVKNDGSKLDGWSWFEFLPRSNAEELEKAKNNLYKLAAGDPDDTTPYYLLANIYLGRDLTFEAIQEYRKLLAKNPSDNETMQELKDLYSLLKLSPKAVQAFEKAFPVK
ncbi:MAG: hypothetical protein GXP49_02675 [Deltaproteobacteria bacterium]|nr:hypothetical protein [Deltaproteobacteria bacterium]